MKKTRLKRCPFCGNEDISLWPMDGWESPLCEICGATFEQNITGENTADQIKAWNARVKNEKTKVKLHYRWTCPNCKHQNWLTDPEKTVQCFNCLFEFEVEDEKEGKS